jgi:hypothetical protein
MGPPSTFELEKSTLPLLSAISAKFLKSAHSRQASYSILKIGDQGTP